jgi:hypothetical protein
MPASEATIWALRLGLLALPMTAGLLAAEAVAAGRGMPRAARVWFIAARCFAAAAAACFAATGLLYLLT